MSSYSHSHGVNCFRIPLCWLCVGAFLLAFFVFCYTYDIMKSALLSVPTTVVHTFTEHTITYTPEFCLPHALAFIICFFGLNCRNFTISSVNHSWSFLRLHCSSFTRLCATESSPTIISRGAFRFYVIAGKAARIRKRKDVILYFGYVHSKGAQKIFQ
jgi:hypothetical protein